MAVATPHFYTEPTVLIGTTEVQCHLSLVTLIPAVEFGDVETYCNPGGEAVSKVSWAGVMRVRMSYDDPDGSWNFFSGLDATVPQEMTIYPADPGTTTGSDTNPEASFDAYIAPIAFIPDHEVGGSATYDIEYKVVGQPEFATS